MSDALRIAVGELGVKEQPVNRVKYNAWYYGKDVSGSGYPWCMAFVQWCFAQTGEPLPLKPASCGALLRWYRDKQPERIVTEPQAGDVAIFDFPGGADTDHCGIVESVGATTVTTIDGNTGVGSESNGGAVMRRTRDKRYVRAYIRPKEAEMRYNTLDEIRENAPWAVDTVRRLMDKGALNGTGTGLDLSRDMLRVLVICDRAGAYQ